MIVWLTVYLWNILNTCLLWMYGVIGFPISKVLHDLHLTLVWIFALLKESYRIKMVLFVFIPDPHLILDLLALSASSRHVILFKESDFLVNTSEVTCQVGLLHPPKEEVTICIIKSLAIPFSLKDILSSLLLIAFWLTFLPTKTFHFV